MANGITQAVVDKAYAECVEAINMFMAGLITVQELAKFLSQMPSDEACAGLLCPHTGLRFPT